MIPLPPTLKLILGTLLVALVAGGQYLLKLEPTWAWLPPGIAALLYVEGFLTVPAKARDQIADLSDNVSTLTAKLGGVTTLLILFGASLLHPFVMLGMVIWRARMFVMSLLVVALITTQTACPQGIPVVGPAASCVTAIVTDALKGMTLAEILADAGPGCAKDVAEIVTVLFGAAATEPRITGTKAYGEAQVIRAKQLQEQGAK
jgi:hypothetical protein